MFLQREVVVAARARFALFALLALVSGQERAHAQDDAAYSAADIIRHFAPRPKFGATRALCLPGQEDCGPTAPAGGATPFDLVVTFELRSDRLTPAAKRNLDEFARALADPALAARRFAVDGHTDARGGGDYNLRLSQRRAASVAAYLAAHGVDPARLTPIGYGKTQPKTANPMDAANRRVETRAAD
jgi:outer membrane protein OmpA-like peptidoglycan-associated protein